jgi:hypothetical protein
MGGCKLKLFANLKNKDGYEHRIDIDMVVEMVVDVDCVISYGIISCRIILYLFSYGTYCICFHMERLIIIPPEPSSYHQNQLVPPEPSCGIPVQ